MNLIFILISIDTDIRTATTLLAIWPNTESSSVTVVNWATNR
jgi:hypothetical protein